MEFKKKKNKDYYTLYENPTGSIIIHNMFKYIV